MCVCVCAFEGACGKPSWLKDEAGGGRRERGGFDNPQHSLKRTHEMPGGGRCMARRGAGEPGRRQEAEPGAASGAEERVGTGGGGDPRAHFAGALAA